MDKPGGNDRDSSSEVHGWLSGGGEMGRQVCAMDWSRSPLGPLEPWPQILRTTVTTKPQGKGTGIGRFLAKNLMEKSTGERLMVRNVAQGAEFTAEVARGSR